MKKYTLYFLISLTFTGFSIDRNPIDVPSLFIYLNSGVEKIENPVSARNIFEIEDTKVTYLFQNMSYDSYKIPRTGNYKIALAGTDVNTVLVSNVSSDTVIVETKIFDSILNRYKFLVSNGVVSEIWEFDIQSEESSNSEFVLEKKYFLSWSNGLIEDVVLEDYSSDEFSKITFEYENNLVLTDSLFDYSNENEAYELSNITEYSYEGGVIDSALTIIDLGLFVLPLELHAFSVDQNNKMNKHITIGVLTGAQYEVELSNSNINSISNRNFASNLKVTYSKERQTITCNDNVKFDLYNVSGKKVGTNFHNGANVSHLEKGIYLVSSNQGNSKI
ncbi:MAG: hypothetical protein SNJ77_02475, partial [Cytophagales bacterium]